MDVDREILDAFLAESSENLAALEIGLVELERSPNDADALARIFRTVHTIKGASGFLGFTTLTGVAHAGESLLGALRDGKLTLTSDITTALLAMVDAIRDMLTSVETHGTDGDTDYHELRELLTTLTAAPTPQHAAESAASVQPLAHATPSPSAAMPATGSSAAPGTAASSTVRVNTDDLDSLMALSAELIGVRTALGDLVEEDEDSAIADTHNQLTRVAARLQSDVMRARLQPMASVLDRYRRVVRDLALELDKQAHVTITGEDIAVDRAINEALKDPLTHLVRNAVDHGIEPSDVRTALGKPPVGTIAIHCSQSHGRVIIEFADDGGGIDPETLRNAAVQRGLFDRQRANELSDQEALELIFHPGLSTAATVTATSGRGVGMDAVQASLQRVGGSITVTSSLNVGTTFHISVPLTVAIMSSLDITCAEQRFAIPLVNVEEVLALDEQEVAGLDNVDGARIFRLRGELVPLVDLARLMKLRETDVDTACTLVVVSSQERRFALVVDSVGATSEIVVKPLPYGVRSIPMFTGITIRGNGRPAMILDISGIATAAEIHHHEPAKPEPTVSEAVVKESAMLVAGSPDGGVLAVRLNEVRRLELLDRGRVERVGGSAVVRLEGGILPLVRVHEVLPERRKKPRGTVPTDTDAVHVVVVDSHAGPVGLWVHSITDIIPAEHVSRQPASRRGVHECVVLGERIAEVLDIDTIVADAGIAARS